MKDKEILENAEEITKESMELTVKGFNEMSHKSKTQRKIFTNITDNKKIFNLETNVDMRINDCVGEKLRVKEVLIKIIEKPIDIVAEETGEIKEDKERKMITILIDDDNRSYVTGSKLFTIQMMNYIDMFGIESITEGLEIKITKRKLKNSSNEALAFEII